MIGTAGTSPYGAYGYNPAGVRIGQKEGHHGRAIKVWDKREFKNLDDSVELGTRNIKVALRRLRQFARTGNPDVLDLDSTIKSTAHKGYLDLQMVPEKHNAVKVLLFLDVGGSMDPHIKICEELFSAARSEFKHLEFFTFTIACMKACGATTAAAMWSGSRPRKSCTPTRRTTNSSSLATHP